MRKIDITNGYRTWNAENITNYRPVFILPCVFKVLERVMYNWLYKYLFEEKLLHSKQPV